MVITLIGGSFLAVLQCLLGTPFNTGQTLLTLILPDQFIVLHDNIMAGTHFQTHPALIAAFIRPEALIHFVNMRKT
jgi:hypothetical protein